MDRSSGPDSATHFARERARSQERLVPRARLKFVRWRKLSVADVGVGVVVNVFHARELTAAREDQDLNIGSGLPPGLGDELLDQGAVRLVARRAARDEGDARATRRTGRDIRAGVACPYARRQRCIASCQPRRARGGSWTSFLTSAEHRPAVARERHVGLVHAGECADSASVMTAALEEEEQRDRRDRAAAPRGMKKLRLVARPDLDLADTPDPVIPGGRVERVAIGLDGDVGKQCDEVVSGPLDPARITSAPLDAMR
jgi:hypothetical protein